MALGSTSTAEKAEEGGEAEGLEGWRGRGEGQGYPAALAGRNVLRLA